MLIMFFLLILTGFCLKIYSNEQHFIIKDYICWYYLGKRTFIVHVLTTYNYTSVICILTIGCTTIPFNPAINTLLLNLLLFDIFTRTHKHTLSIYFTNWSCSTRGLRSHAHRAKDKRYKRSMKKEYTMRQMETKSCYN